jgi:beta-phosphoglucomutase-like phosphatase (HAD superfamily)
MTSVLFDFNGTLSDDEWVLCEIFRELFAEAGRPMSQEEYYGLLGLSDPDIVEVWLGRPDPGIVERKIAEYRSRVSDGNTIDEETREAVRLAAAHGPVAVVSGSARSEIEPVLDAAGLLEVVAVVVPREDVALGKPAPDGYVRALELLGVDTGAAVEDSPPGVVAAKAAGLRCAGLTRAFTSDALPGADLYASAVDRELIRRLVSSA